MGIVDVTLASSSSYPDTSGSSLLGGEGGSEGSEASSSDMAALDTRVDGLLGADVALDGRTLT